MSRNMHEDSLSTFFADMPVPAGLAQHILLRIQMWQRRQLFARAAGFFTLALASLFGLYGAYQYVATELYLSGFSEYLKLFFTDNDMLFASWREFGLSLFESMPVMGFLMLCMALFLLITSGTAAAKYIKNARQLHIA